MSNLPQQQEHRDANETGKPAIRVTISADKMKVSVRIPNSDKISEPLTVADISEALTSNKVTFGIINDAIERIVNESLYDETVDVAHGKPPTPGSNAELNYHFDLVHKLQPKEDSDGRIDYKDINFVRSAELDQLLVEKIPAKAGVPGMNVFGEVVSAPAGKDIQLPVGQNTKISEDGLKLLASRDGSIVTTAKRVSINEVHTIGGGVNSKTGNIQHNGSLIIKGNVESNFEVVALGDIEVYNNVADSRVISGGNIMVKGGFLGSRNGLIKAAGDVHCKYINDQILEAGQTIYVGGEVFNSLISAGQQINISGSKGRIVGGRAMAKDEIRATCIGSDAGTRTELQVAYDAELMKTYYAVTSELKHLAENLERVNEGLVVFYRQQLDGKLSPGKEAAMMKLEEFKKDIPQRTAELQEEKAKLEQHIQQNQRARIIAVQRIYPGVILQFGVIYKEITDIMGPSYFSLQGSTIIHEEYKPSKGDA